MQLPVDHELVVVEHLPNGDIDVALLARTRGIQDARQRTREAVGTNPNREGWCYPLASVGPLGAENPDWYTAERGWVCNG